MEVDEHDILQIQRSRSVRAQSIFSIRFFFVAIAIAFVLS